MKRKILTAAVGAALTAAAAPASALLPGAAIGNSSYISGASAQEGQLLNFIRYACSAGTLDVFKQSNQFIYACTRVNAPDKITTTAANIVIYKSSVGGSGNGVLPVAQGSTLAFMDFASLNTTTQCAAPVAIPAVGSLIGYNEYTCTQPTTNVVTEMGLSDVEPGLFIGNLAGLNTTLVNRMQVNPINQLIFGVPVTTVFRDALQAAQGLAVGSELEGDMPSLSKSQVTGIYTGSIATWDQLGLTNGADPFNAIWVARRVQSSGTQTSARVHFLNDPCSPNMAQFVQDLDPNVATSATACSAADPIAAGFSTVFQGSGSGNVVTCLNAHNTNSRWAVGVLSTEFIAGSAGNTGYRFVKIDGVAPTTYNAAQGRYHYVMEATLQWRKTGAGIPSPLAGDDLQLGNSLKNGFNNPVVIKAINDGLVQAYGQGGILGVPGANVPDDPITPANIITKPVSAFTKSASGATNNCQPLQPTQPGSKTGFDN